MQRKSLAVRILAGLLLCCLVFVSLPLGCSGDDADLFAMYLVVGEMSYYQAHTTGLSNLSLAASPVIATDDIVVYHSDTHEIELTATAFDRIENLDVPVSGLPFVVCVGDMRVYDGTFWVAFSSQSSAGVVIMKPLASNPQSIRIQLGYPGDFDFQGKDPRSDERIMQALEHSGKLAGG